MDIVFDISGDLAALFSLMGEGEKEEDKAAGKGQLPSGMAT